VASDETNDKGNEKMRPPLSRSQWMVYHDEKTCAAESALIKMKALLESIESQMPDDLECSDELLARHMETSQEVEELESEYEYLKRYTYEDYCGDYAEYKYDEMRDER
jgi:hypothetical protein